MDYNLENRNKEFSRNDFLEEYLRDLNSLLKISETEALKMVYEYKYPIVFVVGALRSGTTLMTQWLSATGQFGYASNLMSRFYEAPVIGAKIQRMLLDEKLNYRNELKNSNTDELYKSVYGKTQGILEPNEFWYFWRRFVPDEACYYSDDELFKMTDIELMRKEFYGISGAFERPFVVKALNCNFNIAFLNKVFPKVIFIYIKRNIDNNIESVLTARKKYYGDVNKWYSFPVPDYKKIIKISDAREQVKKQIESINAGVKQGLKLVSEEKKVVIDYETFCNNPRELYEIIRKKLLLQDCVIDSHYNGVENFNYR